MPEKKQINIYFGSEPDLYDAILKQAKLMGCSPKDYILQACKCYLDVEEPINTLTILKRLNKIETLVNSQEKVISEIKKVVKLNG